ncbi:LAGLIDADG family homing endonuclease [Halobacillus trueperi]|uniref:LAGLIDADG family homing endonuclease n=1 Tax=Halobacillus trueperi TaxID=156205 RepID=UPI0037357CE3
MSRPLRKRTMSKVDIAQLYKAGESTTVIAEKANVSPDYIRIVLKELGVPLRPRGSWKRKFKVSEDYFKTWSNNMAYILGFIAADGMISGHAQLISIAQKEKEILLDIKREMESSHPITKNERTGVHMLNIGSKILKEDLIHIHGIIPKKSLTLKYPNVPREYQSHFVRGYFDGDGCIYRDKHFINIVGGSKSFMMGLINVLRANDIESRLNTNHDDLIVRVYVSGKEDVENFFYWIYDQKGIYLERKYSTFLKLLK